MVDFFESVYIDHYAWVTLKTYLPVKKIGNKFLKLPRHNDRYGYGPSPKMKKFHEIRGKYADI